MLKNEIDEKNIGGSNIGLSYSARKIVIYISRDAKCRKKDFKYNKPKHKTERKQ